VPYLLNLIYLALVTVLSPWLIYSAIRKGKYRRGLRAKLLGQTPIRSDDKFCIWLHAVSVGEVNLLKPILQAIEREHPDWECVISTTTQTGFELAQQKYSPRTVFYCPLDFTWSVKRALRRIRPDMLILAELELWPNLIHYARKSGAKIAIVNGRLSANSARGYGRLGSFVGRLLGQINLIAVQNVEYKNRFLALNAKPESVDVTGSIKFDGAESDRDNLRTQELSLEAGISPLDKIFLAGSTQAPEEQLSLETLAAARKSYPAANLRLILVPRHPDRFDEVAKQLDDSQFRWIRRSELTGINDGSDSHNNSKNRAREWEVLLVDVVGELGAWWGTAHIGFVGGSMGTRGGQNMIEPAAYGVATCFGPKTSNFRDVVAMLIDNNAARVVADGEELTKFVLQCIDDEKFAQKLGASAQSLVESQQGATQRTLTLLEQLVERDSIAQDTAHPRVGTGQSDGSSSLEKDGEKQSEKQSEKYPEKQGTRQETIESSLAEAKVGRQQRIDPPQSVPSKVSKNSVNSPKRADKDTSR
jgi:3-deoxy-D-manno-octulosonic-acid transferase